MKQSEARVLLENGGKISHHLFPKNTFYYKERDVLKNEKGDVINEQFFWANKPDRGFYNTENDYTYGWYEFDKVIDFIEIPYGKEGKVKITVPRFDIYKTHSLCMVKTRLTIISNKTGRKLNRVSLNRHLPEISSDTWKLYVDWVLELPKNTPNDINNPYGEKANELY